jgi:hypothetical protein
MSISIKEYLFIIEDQVMINNWEIKYISKGVTYLLGPLLDRYYEVIRIQLYTKYEPFSSNEV